MDADTQHPIILFDGVCVFCNFWASFVLRHDHSQHFKLGHLQSEAGQALLERFGLATGQMESVVLIDEGRYFTRSDAVLRILTRLPAPWRWLRIFRVVPAPLRNACYDLIGRWRYRLFGRYDACPAASKAHRGRFID